MAYIKKFNASRVKYNLCDPNLLVCIMYRRKYIIRLVFALDNSWWLIHITGLGFEACL